MTPEHLAAVQGSWPQFVDRRDAMVVALTARFAAAAPSPIAPARRAVWLFDAVATLVDLLPAPSRLGDCARELGARWPDPLAAPCFAVEGRAWMTAAADCIPTWSAALETSWGQAWLLLSEVLAAETLSPFADDPACAAGRVAGIPGIGSIARRARTVVADDIVRFTEMTGDRNPLHYDELLAAASRFGGIIVQGGVTSGLLNAIVAEDLPGPGTVFLQVDWKFLAPVRPGDRITAEVEVLHRRDDKPIGTLRTTITEQHGTVVLDGTAVVYREPLATRCGRPAS